MFFLMTLIAAEGATSPAQAGAKGSRMNPPPWHEKHGGLTDPNPCTVSPSEAGTSFTLTSAHYYVQEPDGEFTLLDEDEHLVTIGTVVLAKYALVVDDDAWGSLTAQWENESSYRETPHTLKALEEIPGERTIYVRAHISTYGRWAATLRYGGEDIAHRHFVATTHPKK